MRSMNWDGVDWGNVPDPERSLSRVRMHHANGMMSWRSGFSASVPSTRPGDLEPWIRGIKEYYATLPYRLIKETIGPDPADPRYTVARLRFERTDIEQLQADLRRRRAAGGRGDGDSRRPAGPATTRPAGAAGPDRERILRRLRWQFEGADPPPRVHTVTTSVPRDRRDLLDRWTQIYKDYFAGTPYRLVEETVTEDPSVPGTITGRLRFERIAPDDDSGG